MDKKFVSLDTTLQQSPYDHYSYITLGSVPQLSSWTKALLLFMIISEYIP